VIADSQQAKRGKALEAVAKLKDPTTEGYSRGPQDVCALLVVRGQVSPWGIQLSVKPEHAKALELPFYQTTELAVQLLRECKAPAGIKVMVLLEAYSLCHTVVKACREPPCPFASTLKRHRSLFKQGWKRNAGRDGKHLVRRRRTESCVLAKPQGAVCSRCVEAGGLEVRKLGQLHGVCSRKGSARKILGLVTAAPELSAAGRIRTDENRWAVEQFFKDRKQLLGLGQDQHRPDRAAVTPRHLVGLASALLPHLRIQRRGAPGQRRQDKAADLAVATAQEPLRGLLWDDLVGYLKEQHRGEAALAELERLRVA
jgi:hypothetical protein